jgi:hypothetical protein
MSQAYSRPPSDLYGVAGAASILFDRGIFRFGRYVEGMMEQASEGAQNEAFARSHRLRAFAECMGDDMTKSTAGYADPFVSGGGGVIRRGEDNPDDGEILASGY